ELGLGSAEAARIDFLALFQRGAVTLDLGTQLLGGGLALRRRAGAARVRGEEGGRIQAAHGDNRHHDEEESVKSRWRAFHEATSFFASARAETVRTRLT